MVMLGATRSGTHRGAPVRCAGQPRDVWARTHLRAPVGNGSRSWSAKPTVRPLLPDTAGHFRGPGRTIQFTILGRGGRLILRQVGATSRGISDIAYDGGAWFSWRTQAATLRAALSRGAHGPDHDRV